MTCIDLDTREGLAIITLFSQIKEVEHVVADVLNWFRTLGIDPDEDCAFPGEDPASIVERLRWDRECAELHPADRYSTAGKPQVAGHFPQDHR
jgi:hypothetical protein